MSNLTSMQKRIATFKIAGFVFDITLDELYSSEFYNELQESLHVNGFLTKHADNAYAVEKGFELNITDLDSSKITGFETHRLYPHEIVQQQLDLIKSEQIAEVPFPCKYTKSE